MADEGNEDSWLYGNTNAEGKNGEKADDEAADGDVAGKDGTSRDETGGQSQWETEEPSRATKRPRSSFSDDEHHQHDDNAMDSSDLGQSRGDSTRREDDFHGEEDSHLQEDESHDQERTEKPDRSDGEMDTDDSDDDDDINVVIGDIKSGPSYNIIKQRGPIVPPQVAQAAPGQDKAKQPAGKFSIEEFESVGTINGVPAHEFSIDSLEEKPWRKPGADITDYFNYGFNEETWRAYCERQKRMRMHESGVGLQGLTINNPQAAQAQNNWRQGPPPPRKMNNGIDVIGGMSMHPRPEHGPDMMPRHPKENIIQVMTADRREYSRSASKFDSPMGPPPFGAPPDFYHNEPDYGDYGYEPTQESQWNQEPNWQPHGIKTLTPGPPPMMGMGMPPPHMDMMPPPMQPGMMGPPGMGPPGMRGHDRERDRDRDRGERDRDRERGGRQRDRDREREHRRERERDREREASISKPEPVEMERSRSEKPDRERGEAEKDKRSSKSERHKDRYRERSRSREKSKARRRSRSRERERAERGERHSSRSEKKKSHRKDKEEDE
ncbi:AAEL008100-PA [Aedes aegypti]|uniref:AAEL008100-PA n=2 Tax=Aedes aegypti TaxID=7159 RepID=Q0IER5_AEDAE|nr:pre-mRNA 3'-end-processing factor FIP1 [Aedes aegypti]ABM68607.1 AAEL008100-PA [Aedes aegypti]EAT40140.1 AAEL008100-PA [Aedes aegypti]